MRDTVWPVYHGPSVMHHVCEARRAVDPLWDRYIEMMYPILFGEDGPLAHDHESDEGLGASMEPGTRSQGDDPGDRLLVWEPADGWEPLCEFLEVAVPTGRCRASTTPPRSPRASSVAASR